MREIVTTAERNKDGHHRGKENPRNTLLYPMQKHLLYLVFRQALLNTYNYNKKTLLEQFDIEEITSFFVEITFAL